MIVVGNLEQILLSIIASILIGMGYGVTFYIKKYLKNRQPFNPKKMLRTILIAMGVGVLLAPENPMTFTAFFDLMEKIFAGTISTEALLTIIVRWYKWITGEKVTSQGKATYRPSQ
ncbi:hypothetical protein DRN41_08325 [Thermococci archaeon]|nr:MAG: hypothetical protein DRN41_08325 [Thermococci archaeon]